MDYDALMIEIKKSLHNFNKRYVHAQTTLMSSEVVHRTIHRVVFMLLFFLYYFIMLSVFLYICSKTDLTSQKMFVIHV